MDRQPLLTNGFDTVRSFGKSLSGQNNAEKRFALIIANQRYVKNPIPNIENDAMLMQRTLESLGFSVAILMNASSYGSMAAKLKEFQENLIVNPGAIGFFYYSGHGVQFEGENYLVPINNASVVSLTVHQQCVSLWTVLDLFIETKAKVVITVLDACREYPYFQQQANAKKGLAVFSSVLNERTIVSFSASPGETTTTADGSTSSIFTPELVKQLQKPYLSILEVFQLTRSSVRKMSQNKQCPREYNGLEESIYLNGSDVPITKQSTSIRLELNGVPTGAKVTLDGTKLYSNVYTDEIFEKSKSFNLVVDANGFRRYESTVVVPRGSHVVHNVTLKSKPADVKRLAKYAALRAYVDSMCLIPAGTFLMGTTNGDSNQAPKHKVRLSTFRMGATPVTVALWKEYCAATGTKLPYEPDWIVLDDHPVIYVSWNDIMGVYGEGGFCAWASEIAGFRVTLPTEAQWEYSARSGIADQKYPWGNTFDQSKVAYLNSNAHRPLPVNRLNNIYRNVYGLTDLGGNVDEWCFDFYDHYGRTLQTDPMGPYATQDGLRCIRGRECARRYGSGPNYIDDAIGFRLSAKPS